LTDRKIKAVLFDLGETLLNFGEVNTNRLFQTGAKLSYDFLKGCGQPVGSFKYYCWRNLIALRLRQWLSSITRRDFNSLVLLRGVGTKRGIKLDRQQWRHFAWLWYEPLSQVSQVEPGIAETLGTLKSLGLKLGIVSNTFVTASSLDKNLERFGILDFFPVRIYSYEFDFRKPDARIFKTAAEKVGEMPQNIMFVGDRIDKDVKPAAKAGMWAVLKAAYTNIGKKIPEGIWKINQIAELPALVEKINAELP
jgi:HAD superfamily hydrolase (TIGR01549 family)